MVSSQVLNSLRQGRPDYVAGTAAAERLDEYLNRATRVPFRQRHGGLALAPIRECLLACEAVVNPEEQALLKEGELKKAQNRA